MLAAFVPSTRLAHDSSRASEALPIRMSRQDEEERLVPKQQSVTSHTYTCCNTANNCARCCNSGEATDIIAAMRG
jgi:hypothetical protein